jgi:hypothetical protein
VKYDGHSELLKAAPKRLRDAQELLEAPTREPHTSDAAYRHLCAAEYLAGYAVECVLKTYIILLIGERSSEHVARWSEAVKHLDGHGTGQDLGGKHGHNLLLLLNASGLGPALEQDPSAYEAWARCAKWDYNIRYQPRPLADRARVDEFVGACSTVYHWVRARLPFAHEAE